MADPATGKPDLIGFTAFTTFTAAISPVQTLDR